MGNSYSHRIDETEAGMRLDTFLGELTVLPSRNAAAKLILQGDVRVNGETANKKHLLSEGDLVVFDMPEQTKTPLKGEYIPLDIHYEDDYLIVLSKQEDLVCHPSVGHETGTLVNALIAHCGIDHLGTLQGDDRPGIVHRLDKDTTGLMLVAKDNETQAMLQDAIRIRSIDRRYITLVHGNIAHDTGLVDAPIARDSRERMRMTISDAISARSSVTTFTVLERFDAGRFDNGYTLLECKLYTGRTHQIRVHMAYIKHPCVGDQLYGSGKLKADRQLTRQFLHSYRLSFEHPQTGEKLEFFDALPEDLAACLAGLEDRSAGRTEEGERILSELARLDAK